MADWSEVTIGSQLTLQRGFDITKAEQKMGRVPVVSSGGVSSYHDEYQVKGPGVVLGRKEVVGSVFFVKEDFWPHDTSLWVRDFKGNDERFVYYFFKSIAGALKSMDVGSANPALNRNHVHPISVRWPTRRIQESIAHVLGCLDEKIKLNRKTNQTLEAMAQALFKSWFVDFDPVIDNALAAGNDIPEPLEARAAARQALGDARKPLPEEVRREFPDEFEFRDEMGWLPQGWHVSSLDLIADYRNGLALQKFRPADDSEYLPVLKIAQLRIDEPTHAEKASVDIPEDFIVRDGDVVFSWSGSLMLRIWCGGIAALNQHLFKVTSNEFPKWFYLEWTETHLEEFKRAAADKAVTMGHIKRSHLKEAKCVIPTTRLLQHGTTYFEPLLEKQIAVRLEARALGSLRDTLLPKLLSGELTIPDAEKLAADAL